MNYRTLLPAKVPAPCGHRHHTHPHRVGIVVAGPDACKRWTLWESLSDAADAGDHKRWERLADMWERLTGTTVRV